MSDSSLVTSVKTTITEIREKLSVAKEKKIVIEDQYIALAKQKREEHLRNDKATKHYESEIATQERLNEKELSDYAASIELLEGKRDALIREINDKYDSKISALERKEIERKEKRDITIKYFKGKIESSFDEKPLEIKYPPSYYKVQSEVENYERQIRAKESLIQIIKQGEKEDEKEREVRKSHINDDESWKQSPEYLADEAARKKRYAIQMIEHKKRIEEANEAERQAQVIAGLAKKAIAEAEGQRVKQKYENIALGISTGAREDDEEDGDSACGDDVEDEENY